MDNKLTTLLLVVIIGVLVGVGVTSKQKSTDPMVSQLLESQIRIEQALQGGNAGNAGALEARLSAVEQKLATLETTLKQVKAAPAPTQAAKPAPTRPADDFTTKHDIPVDHSIVIGPKDAKVTIVEFMDLECPFCARFHPPIEQVLAAYPKDVNYIVKNFPLSFHPNAKPAAKAAFAAAEQGKYREMVNALLENGRNLNPAMFEKLAGELGLNVKKFKKDLADNDAKYEEWVKKDMALATKVGVRGTPTFYLNGKKTRARDFQSYKAEIDAILKK